MTRVRRRINRIRLNLDITQTTKDQLLRLVEKSNADSMTEIVRRALNVYEVVLGCKQDGDLKLVHTKDGVDRLVFFIV